MAIEFDCPVCGATVRVKDEAAGKKGRCPKCKTLLLVPEPEDAAAAPAPSKPEPAPAPPAAAAISVPAAPAPPVEPPVAAALPPASPAPVANTEPAAPFSFAAIEPPPAVSPAASARKGGVPTARIVSVVAAVLSLAGVLAAVWFFANSSVLNRTERATAERVTSPSLPAASLAAPADIPKEVRGPVMEALTGDGLSLKSEFVTAVIKSAGEDRLTVAITPGPQAEPVRLDLAGNDAVQAAVKEQVKAIEKAKRKELADSTEDFFRAYAAYLKQRTPLDRLPAYRDGIALNAATGVAGYAVEALVNGRLFRCAYEDAEGRCYFFLPAGTKTFRLHGRELPGGTPPVEIDIEVAVKAAPKEPAKPPEPKQDGAATEPKKGEAASESKEKAAPEAKPEAMSPPMAEPVKDADPDQA